MMLRLAQLSKDSLIYGIGGALARYMGLILLPVYTHAFTAADYGLLESAGNLSALLLAITLLGLDAATSLLYFETTDPHERQRICTLWVWISILVSIPTTLLLIAGADWVSQLASGTTKYADLFRVAIAVLPFNLLHVVFTSILRLMFRPRLYSLLNFGLATLTGLLSIYFVVFLRLGLSGALWGILIGTALASTLGAWVLRDLVRISTINPISGSLHLNWLWAIGGRLLRLGLPLVPASIALWTISFSSTYFLIQLRGVEEAGIFRVGARLTALLGMGLWAFQLAWGPYSLSVARQPDAPRIYSRVATIFTASSVGVSIFMAAFAPVLTLVFATKEYATASSVVGILSLAAAALGVYHIISIGANLAQRTGQIAKATIMAAALNIFLNFVLIPAWGIVGAGLAVVASNLVSTVLIYWESQRIWPIPYAATKLLVIWSMGSACVAVAAIFNVGVVASLASSTHSIWILPGCLGIGLLLLAAYGYILFASGVVALKDVRLVCNAGANIVTRGIRVTFRRVSRWASEIEHRPKTSL